MSKVRWGFVGAGRHPRLWVGPAVARAHNATAAGVWSRQRASADLFQREQGVARAYDRLEDLLADSEIDAVFISTPNALHAEHALAALRAGKHVLVEKPMAASVADAVAMVEAARQAGTILGLGFHFRHHDLIVEAARRVADGAIGTPLQVTAQFNLTSSPPPRLQIAHAAWKRDPEQMGGAGALMGMGVHLIDTVRFVVGQEIVAVQAVASGTAPDQPLESMGQCLLEFAGGAQGHLLYGGRFPLSRNDLVVYGTGGRIVADSVLDVFTTGVLHAARPHGATGWRSESIRLELTDHYEQEIIDFSAAVLGGPAFRADGVDGLRSVEVQLAVIESVQTGRRVSVSATGVA